MSPTKTTKELQEDKPDENIDKNQRQNFRNSNRTRKILITRSNDFLWQTSILHILLTHPPILNFQLQIIHNNFQIGNVLINPLSKK